MDATTALTFTSVVAGAIVTGVGSAMAWFRLQRVALDKVRAEDKKIYEDEFKNIWFEVRQLLDKLGKQAIDIRGLEEKMSNNTRRLDEIYDNTNETKKSVADLSKTFTDVLIELRSR